MIFLVFRFLTLTVLFLASGAKIDPKKCNGYSKRNLQKQKVKRTCFNIFIPNQCFLVKDIFLIPLCMPGGNAFYIMWRRCYINTCAVPNQVFFGNILLHLEHGAVPKQLYKI